MRALLDAAEALHVQSDGREVRVAEALGDLDRRAATRTRRRSRRRPRAGTRPEPAIAPLGAVPALPLDETLRPAEPSARRPQLAPDGKRDPQPARTPRGREILTALDVGKVCAFQHGEVLVHPANQRGGRGQQIEVRRRQRIGAVSCGQRRVGVEPGPPLERGAAALELLRSIDHGPTICDDGLGLSRADPPNRRRRPLPHPLGAGRDRRLPAARPLRRGQGGLDDLHAARSVHRAARVHDAAARERLASRAAEDRRARWLARVDVT